MNGKNAFPKTSQILPIGCIGGGIRIATSSLELVVKITMKMWVNDIIYWIRYKVN